LKTAVHDPAADVRAAALEALGAMKKGAQR
jgi:hypothetical protein